MTSLNHDFNISSSCLAGNNHALPQHLHNPVHFLSIRRVYFHNNAANHPAKAKAAMFDTDVGSSSRSALALIGREAHVLVLHMREAFHRWKFPALCLAEYHLPPLDNAFTHVYDNCKITSKTRNAAVKIKNNAGKYFQYASSCSSVANDAEKMHGN